MQEYTLGLLQSWFYAERDQNYTHPLFIKHLSLIQFERLPFWNYMGLTNYIFGLHRYAGQKDCLYSKEIHLARFIVTLHSNNCVFLNDSKASKNNNILYSTFSLLYHFSF